LKVATVQGAHDTYRLKVWAQVNSRTCDDHAYGQPVISYLTTHPCSGLTRRLVTTTVGGRDVGIATSSLGFAGPDPGVYTIAGNFQTLVSKDGTGNLDDLFRDGYRLPSGPARVPSPDAFRALGQDAGVVVADAWYLTGTTPDNDPALLTMLEETFLQY
jgi:hypothetical protein